jgi:hypothetical protein
MRLLVEEMQKDPEVADAIRADLAAALSAAAQAHVRSTMGDHNVDDGQQQQLFGADQYNQVPSVMSYALRMREAVASLEASHADSVSRLQHIEDLLSRLQLSQLQAAVVLSVTSPAHLSDSGAVIRVSVDVADSLEKMREATRQLSQSAEVLRETTHEVGEQVAAVHEFSGTAARLREATLELSRCTERLHVQVQRVVEDRLASAHHEPIGGFYSRFGEMLNLGPRLHHSEFDPGVRDAFRSTGDLLSRSLLSIWQSNESRKPAPIDSAMTG